MLVVNLLGGLGNQMFQYAFGRALSIRLDKVVKYSNFQLLERPANASYTLRNYELDVFRVPVDIATVHELRLFGIAPAHGLNDIFYKVQRRLVNVRHFIEKIDFAYDETVFASKDHTYYAGYWQNELYFKPYEQLLRDELQLKTSMSERNAAIAGQIKSAPIAVSLHVRRGDYISNADANRAHGSCSPDYYAQAVDKMQNSLGEVHLFVFSDEPDWVKANMQFKTPVTYISHNTGKDSAEDMRLMSLCKHNIIANSSFSWWGAWLNPNPQKIVVAPKLWMQMPYGVATGPVPSTWISL